MLTEREIGRFQGYLQQQGLKLTTERQALVREIFGAHYHFEAEQLLERMREKRLKISRATVYRTLDLLVKSGMVRRVHLGEDHYHYERVAENSHHDHLVCTTCGGVIEFHDPVLEERQRLVCSRRGFTPTFHNLQILGICARCRRNGQHPDVPDRVEMERITETRLRK